MLVKLFDIQNGKVIPTEHCYTLKFLKSIMDKYPDKVVDVYSEGYTAVLVLDTCRIKFTKEEINKGAEDGN